MLIWLKFSASCPDPNPDYTANFSQSSYQTKYSLGMALDPNRTFWQTTPPFLCKQILKCYNLYTTIF